MANPCRFASERVVSWPCWARNGERLQADHLRVWLSPENLRSEKSHSAMEEAIGIYDRLVLVLSAESVASGCAELLGDAAMKKEHGEKRMVLFPIRLDDAVMDVSAGWAADLRRTRHLGDFGNWREPDAFEAAYKRLLRDLRASTKPPALPGAAAASNRMR